MSLTITCYGGVNEIGGNKILLEDGAIRIFLDFGHPFDRYSIYFDGIFIRERSSRGLMDPMVLGLLPPLEGLYREDLLPVLDPSFLKPWTETDGKKERKRVERDEKAYEDFWSRFRHRPDYRDLRRDGPPVDAILISHAHLDHSGDLLFVQANIAVFSSLMTAMVAKAVQDSGRPGSNGVVYVNPQAINESGMLEGDRTRGYIWRNWYFLDQTPQGIVQENDPFASAASFWQWRPAKQDKASSVVASTSSPHLKVHWWPLDHSIFGACGFAVETSAGWVAYTGDIRFHGAQKSLSQRFAEELAALKPLVLICEGTNLEVEKSPQVTEEEVQYRCLDTVRRSERELVIADFAPRNVERLMAFLEIARNTGRLLVIQPKDAYLLSAMHLADPKLVSNLKEEPCLFVYNDPKVRQDKWEEITRQFYSEKLVGPQEIQKDPGNYILAFSLWDMADLLDLEYLMRKSPMGGVYIYSNSKVYDEEQKVDLERLWNWLQRLGMKPVGLELSRAGKVDVTPGYHASGHASGLDLIQFVKEVRPRVLIPIHTEKPDIWLEELRGTDTRVEIPSYARPIPLEEVIYG